MMSVCAVDVRDALYKISFKNSYGACTSCPLLLTGVKRVGFATINGVAPRCPFAAATMMTTFSMHSELKSPPLIPSSPSTPHTHTSHVCMYILYMYSYTHSLCTHLTHRHPTHPHPSQPTLRTADTCRSPTVSPADPPAPLPLLPLPSHHSTIQQQDDH